MHGTTHARAMEQWHKDHNGRHDDPEWIYYLERWGERWADKLEELMSEHSNDGKLGMSKAGGCTRSAGLKFLDDEAEPFSGSTRFTFMLGHMIEVHALVTAEAIGVQVDDSQAAVVIEPMMHSFTDGDAIVDGETVTLSIKSTGYKKSGKQGNKWVRRGFPELPFEGVRVAQPTHWVQAQAELHAKQLMGETAFTRCLYIAVSKDIIKAMENDPYLGEEGNGSLTFYTEFIEYDQRFCETELVPIWRNTWDAVQAGKPGPAYFIEQGRNQFAKLKTASTDWKPNADYTGTYNPCNYCDLLSACQTRLASEWRK